MFKKFISYILGVCFVLCLGACNKENLLDGDSHNEPLVIKLSFASTRTVLEGYTPKFEAEDWISVFDNSGNGVHVGDFQVEINNGIAEIKIPPEQKPKDVTNMQFIYPAGSYTSSVVQIINKTTFKAKISKTQDGTFANANICQAKEVDLDESKGCVSFELCEALLKFDLSEFPDISELTISSDEQLNHEQSTVPEGSLFSTNVVFSNKDLRVYYVAVLAQTSSNIIIQDQNNNTWYYTGAKFDNDIIYPIILK